MSHLNTFNKYSAGKGFSADFANGPTGAWATGNFAEIQHPITVRSDSSGVKDYLYSRSCTRI